MGNGKIWRAAAIGHTGHGDFGHGLHVAYKGLPGVEMVAIADPDDEGRAKAQEQTGAQRAYADYQEMLDKEDLDVVSVCPRHTVVHLELTEAVAKAGCHIYCEKAIARDLIEADQIVEVCEGNNVKIAVSHQSRYVEPWITAREMVKRGDIGQLLCIHGRGKEDRRGGGEDMLTLGTHVFDMMRFIAGDPDWVFGHVTVDGRDISRKDAAEPTEPIGPVAGDAISGMYGFPNGVRGTFTSVRGQHTRGSRMGTTLVGTEGTLVLRWGAPILISRTKCAPEEGGDFEEIEVPDEPTVPGAEPLEKDDFISRGNRLAVWDLIQSAEEDNEPISSGKDARFALEMILGVYATHLARCRLAFPLEDRKHPLDR